MAEPIAYSDSMPPPGTSVPTKYTSRGRMLGGTALTIHQQMRMPHAPTSSGGGSSAPSWVPADAKIYIDFLGGSPQGRAWLDGTGEVAIETLLGFYDPEYMVPGQGLVANTAMDLIGSALTLVLGSFTARIQYFWPGGIFQESLDQAFYARGATTDYYFQITLNFPSVSAQFEAANETFLNMSDVPFNTDESADVLNALAFTFTTIANGGRMEYAVNGSAVTSGTYDTDDRPVANPLVYARVAMENIAIQSITFYDPLPTTAGLSALSSLSS